MWWGRVGTERQGHARGHTLLPAMYSTSLSATCRTQQGLGLQQDWAVAKGKKEGEVIQEGTS